MLSKISAIAGPRGPPRQRSMVPGGQRSRVPSGQRSRMPGGQYSMVPGGQRGRVPGGQRTRGVGRRGPGRAQIRCVPSVSQPVPVVAVQGAFSSVQFSQSVSFMR
eukprot:gene15352-biopygen10091